ncbi:MAG: hypothetical protein JWN76_129 [Chitinophagaceae bacterium]|nr:hypothetical protein [Chitinophagaceae bacterium]
MEAKRNGGMKKERKRTFIKKAGDLVRSVKATGIDAVNRAGSVAAERFDQLFSKPAMA